MGLFKGLDAYKNWEDNLSMEDLDKMEANGQDVKELRERILAKQKAKAEKNERLGQTDFSRLEPYMATPRDRDTEFFKVNAGKPPFFGKAKFYERYENAKIVFPMVVQAAPSMYEPGDSPSAAIIVLHVLDEAHKNNFEFMRTVADLLVDMRDGIVEVPAKFKKLVKDLNNPKSHINFDVDGEDFGADYFKGAKLLVDTVYLSQDKLPGTRIPNDSLLAMLDVHEDGEHRYYQLIHGSFYEKK
ncbi:MAG: hypothetical protein KGV57_04290 [Fusobacterium sp.]|nr:hypothetical protein [Fusobacterium sp.]